MDMYFISLMASISFKMLAMRSIPQFFLFFTKELIPITKYNCYLVKRFFTFYKEGEELLFAIIFTI